MSPRRNSLSVDTSQKVGVEADNVTAVHNTTVARVRRDGTLDITGLLALGSGPGLFFKR